MRSVAAQDLQSDRPRLLAVEQDVDGVAELTPVELGGQRVGPLRDIIVERSGVLLDVVVDAAGSELGFDETVRFRPRSRSAA